MMTSEYHLPVLLKECIDGLDIKKDGTYVDVTFGGGGHSKEILKHLKTGKLIAFDQDLDAIENSLNDDKFQLIRSNFKYIRNFLRYNQAIPIDGLLADLGISSHQIDKPERGFSTRLDADLDMRMNVGSSLSAYEVVNNYPESELARVFKDYADLREARRAARKIIKAREEKSIQTTEELVKILSPIAPRLKENQFHSRVFQAIRIEVNGEMEALKKLLDQCNDLIKIGGRLVVISYHSLEDRMVKNFIKTGNTRGELKKDFFGNPEVTFKSLTSKPIIPSETETENNNRARSAKLRIAERIA